MKLKSIWNELWKCYKLAWYHHFTHIACARKCRGLRQKLDALRVQNRQSPSKYHGFKWELICYKGISFFWTYLNSILFVCSKCTIERHITKFQQFPTSCYHHVTHIACVRKLIGLRQKLDAVRVQNGQSLSKYQGFERELISYKGISFFWTYLNSIFFVCSKCTIQRHITKFQQFLSSFGIFRAFTYYFLS